MSIKFPTANNLTTAAEFSSSTSFKQWSSPWWARSAGYSIGKAKSASNHKLLTLVAVFVGCLQANCTESFCGSSPLIYLHLFQCYFLRDGDGASLEEVRSDLSWVGALLAGGCTSLVGRDNSLISHFWKSREVQACDGSVFFPSHHIPASEFGSLSWLS